MNQSGTILASSTAKTASHRPIRSWDLLCAENELMVEYAKYDPDANLGTWKPNETFSTPMWLEPVPSICQCKAGWSGSRCRNPTSSNLSCSDQQTLGMNPYLLQFLKVSLLDAPFSMTRGYIIGVWVHCTTSYFNTFFFCTVGLPLLAVILIGAMFLIVTTVLAAIVFLTAGLPLLAYYNIWDVEQAILVCIPFRNGADVGINVFPIITAVFCAVIALFAYLIDPNLKDDVAQAVEDIEEEVETEMINLVNRDGRDETKAETKQRAMHVYELCKIVFDLYLLLALSVAFALRLLASV